MRCGPHQLVVGAGLEYLLGLLAPLLPGPAAVENPGYPRARQVLENNGVSCCCLPVDEDGLPSGRCQSRGRRCATSPPATSSPRRHHARRTPGRTAPLGGTASRTAVHHRGRLRFRSSVSTPGPCPACRGWRGPTGRWSTSPPAPASRPASASPTWCCRSELLPAWHAKYALYSGTVSRFEQQTLARFITGGYFTRHLARERVAYKARRDAPTKAPAGSLFAGRTAPHRPAHRPALAGRAARPAAGRCSPGRR